MPGLETAGFAPLLQRMRLEYAAQEAIFDLPRSKWFVPDPGGPDLSVQFHARRAATPAGPAAGPHTQLAQNLVLSWLAGGRILELKTVQVNDKLEIPRPCIDAPDVGYNIEFSQELPLSVSLEEYVNAAMLIHVLRTGKFFGEVDLSGPLGDTIFDLSVGYDLAGLRSPEVRGFLASVKDASRIISTRRDEGPLFRDHQLRDLDYPTCICKTVTLSTFHGCPPGEIERIGEFLIGEMDFDLTVKMNPTMLGRERLEHLLHGVLGHADVHVNPDAYAGGLQFDEAVQLCQRLTSFAQRSGHHFGVKFSNTLEVLNERAVFPPGTRVSYLSGPPLHVIALTLADDFRRAVGPELPMSFSAGVNRSNLADVVASGFCPASACTDLLRPPGYARMPRYLHALTERMKAVGASTIDEFIVKSAGGAPGDDVPKAAAANLARVAEDARNDPQYRAERRRTPRKLETKLELFDCLACDRCIEACPNDALFRLHIPPQTFEFNDWIWTRRWTWRGPRWVWIAGPTQTFNIRESHQIAVATFYCNKCGNCATFCPQQGAPFRDKARFDSRPLEEHDSDNEFFICPVFDIWGHLGGRVYKLEYNQRHRVYLFGDDERRTLFPGEPDEVVFRPSRIIHWAGGLPGLDVAPSAGHVLNMRVFHTLRLLLRAVYGGRRVNPLNADMIGQHPAVPAAQPRLSAQA